MKQRKHDKTADAVKALKMANRQIELERNGASHPWVATDRPHKNKKKYVRNRQKKELRDDFGSSFFFIGR